MCGHLAWKGSFVEKSDVGERLKTTQYAQITNRNINEKELKTKAAFETAFHVNDQMEKYRHRDNYRNKNKTNTMIMGEKYSTKAALVTTGQPQREKDASLHGWLLSHISEKNIVFWFRGDFFITSLSGGLLLSFGGGLLPHLCEEEFFLVFVATFCPLFVSFW